MVCEKCGQTIPDEAVFCSYCGLRNTRKVCAACGTELQKEQVFCHVCGLKCGSETPLPEEQKKEKREKQKEQQEKVSCAEALTKSDSLPGKRKSIYYALYIALGVIYAVLAVVLVMFGFSGYYEYSFHSDLYDSVIRRTTLSIEMPVYWMSSGFLFAGIVQHIYIYLKVRKGKKATKVNIVVSIVLMFLAFIMFLPCLVEGYSLHFGSYDISKLIR